MCGDSVDLVNGEPTGTVRVSLGYMSTLHDAQVLLSFMKTCFVDTLTQVKPIEPIRSTINLVASYTCSDP